MSIHILEGKKIKLHPVIIFNFLQIKIVIAHKTILLFFS